MRASLDRPADPRRPAWPGSPAELPALAALPEPPALAGRPGPDLAARADRAGRGRCWPALPRQWGHGDWHPSNLTWTGAGPDAAVAGVLDLSLANRTLAVHDLATALERTTVAWLDLDETGHADRRPRRRRTRCSTAMSASGRWPRPETAALAAVLPVVHVEYALTEVEYFAGIVSSPANADLAYDGYLLGHARWFAGPDGAALLDRLRRGGGDGRPALRSGRVANPSITWRRSVVERG